MSEIVCTECGSSYEIALSETVPGHEGGLDCHVCGRHLLHWPGDQLVVARLITQPVGGPFFAPAPAAELAIA